jgi:antitoxin component YwqK of YwqJK toxin-antitoxin module
MRRSLIALFIGLIMSCPTNAQKRKSDWEHDGLIGRVRRIREEIATMQSDSGTWKEGRRKIVKTTGYDRDGNVREEIFGRRPTERHFSYYYTKEGERVQNYYGLGLRPDSSFNDIAQIGVRTRFKYDADGNRVEEATYRHGDLMGKVTTAYDSAGKKHEQNVYDRDGRTIARLIFNYDEKGNLALVSDFTSPSALKIKEAYAYEFDSIGNWIKRTTSRPVRDRYPIRMEPVEVTYRTISYY